MKKYKEEPSAGEKMAKCVQAAIGFLSADDPGKGWTAPKLEGGASGPTYAGDKPKSKLRALAAEMLLDELKERAPDAWDELSSSSEKLDAFEVSSDEEWLAGDFAPWSELTIPLKAVLSREPSNAKLESIIAKLESLERGEELKESESPKQKTKMLR